MVSKSKSVFYLHVHVQIVTDLLWTWVEWCSWSCQSKGHRLAHHNAWLTRPLFRGGCPCHQQYHYNISILLATNSLVDFREMVSLTEIGGQRSRVAHTLEGRVHEACVAKVTESSSTLRNFDLWYRLLRLVLDNDLLEYCHDLFRPWVVLIASWEVWLY